MSSYDDDMVREIYGEGRAGWPNENRRKEEEQPLFHSKIFLSVQLVSHYIPTNELRIEWQQTSLTCELINAYEK